MDHNVDSVNIIENKKMMKNIKNLQETVIIKPEKQKHDVTKEPKSLAGRLEAFISKMGALDYDMIKDTFEEIIDDPDTQVSREVQYKWHNAIDRTRGNKNKLMQAITNLYLKAGRLGVHEAFNSEMMEGQEKQKNKLKNVDLFEDDTLGFVKLKNIDSFDQFDVRKDELQGGVNEPAIKKSNTAE